MEMMKTEANAEIEMPEDLIALEILSRLPPKVVARFKCVSKAWKSLIDDYCMPKFSDQQPVFALLVNRSYDRQLVAYSDNQKFVYPCCSFIGCYCYGRELSDCCNGLLLLRCEFFGGIYTTIICNPITKQYLRLPEHHKLKRYDSFIHASLAFDTNVSPSQFKVIQFDHRPKNKNGTNGNGNYYYIFSSHNWSWTEFEFKLKDGMPNMLAMKWARKSIYFNKVVYRLSINYNYVFKFFIDNDKLTETDNDRVKVIDLPRQEVSEYYKCLGVSNGNICYAHCNNVPNFHESSLKLWMLKSVSNDYNDEYEWVLKFSVSFESIARDLPIFSIYPCALDPKSDTIFLGCEGGKYPNIYAYDFTTRKLKPHRKLFCLDPTTDFSLFNVFPYAKFFVSLPRYGNIN